MRLALDGLPRDLPLSRAERRQLRAAIRAWKPPEGLAPPFWVALIPAAVMMGAFAVLFPIIHLPGGHFAWKIAAIPVALALQLWLTRRLMFKFMWPYTCRAMAAKGYEVCPTCAYPLKDAAPDTPLCPECGAQRVRTNPPIAGKVAAQRQQPG